MNTRGTVIYLRLWPILNVSGRPSTIVPVSVHPTRDFHLPLTVMEKIFHFDSAPEPYVADAAVLCCFDQRIRTAVSKFLQRQQILRPDMIVVAGGAKTLASPRNDFER